MKIERNSNQLKIGVILSYLTTGINLIVNLVYTPVMIQILGQSEYGLYTLVGSVVSYLSLFSLGFTGAYLRFYSRYESQNDQIAVARLNGMFLTLFGIMSALALICGMVLSGFCHEIFGDNLTVQELTKASILMKLLVINVALSLLCSLMDSIISAHEQFLFQRIVSLAGVVFNPMICLPLLLIGYGSIAVVSITTIITFTKFVVNLWYCLRKLDVKFEFSGFDIALFKEIGGFSFFIFLNMIIDQVNWSVDKLILGRVSGTGAVAVYGVGAQINSLYTMFSSSISSVFAPRVNRIAASGADSMKEEFTELFVKVGRIQSLILFLIASGFVVFGRYFITDVYTTEEYVDSYAVTLLLILPVTIPLIQNIGLEIQRSVNKHKFRSKVYLAMAIINTIISIPLGKMYGSIGCAWGTAASLLLANGLIMNLYYHKVIGINIIEFWKNILSISKGLIIPIIAGVLIMKFVQYTGIISFAAWIVVYSAIYIVSMWLFGMNNFEKNLILQPLKKVIRR